MTHTWQPRKVTLMNQKGLKRAPEKMQQQSARRESRPASALSFQGDSILFCLQHTSAIVLWHVCRKPSSP